MYEIFFTKKYEKIAKNFFKKHQNLKAKYQKTINPTSSSKSSKSPYPEALFDFLKNYLHHIFQF